MYISIAESPSFRAFSMSYNNINKENSRNLFVWLGFSSLFVLFFLNTLLTN